jgi:hypothetical protein
MASILYGLVIIVMVGAPVAVLVWELQSGRTVPPFRIERATRPRWYWSCIVAHALFLALMILLSLLLFVAGVIIPDISN